MRARGEGEVRETGGGGEWWGLGGERDECMLNVCVRESVCMCMCE